MRAVLRQRNLILLVTGSFVSLLGDWALVLALPFYVYSKTGSVLSTGGLVAAELLPRLLVSSFAGVLADRWDRRVAMIAADLFRALLVLAILVPANGGPLWPLYVVAVLQASCGQLFVSSQAALVPTILAKREDILAANSVLSTGTSIVRLVGPPLGGLLYAALGLSMSVAADSASFALSAMAIAAIRPLTPASARTGDEQHVRRAFLGELGDGVRLVRANRVLEVLCLTFGIVMVAQGMLQTLLVPFVRDVLHLDAARYGLLMAAQGSGSLTGALALAVAGRHLTSGRLAIGATLIVAGVGLFGFAAARAFLLNAAFIVLLSIPVVAATVWVRSYYQQHVENRILGRVIGLTENISALGVLCGVAAASVLGGRLGPATLLIVASGVLLAAGITAVVGLGGSSTLIAKPAPTTA
jgi:predicted MFS family arabinose efflux permease